MTEQEFKAKLFAAADALRSNMDASEYKYPVLGLIFLKYVSDAFMTFRNDLEKRISDPEDEMYEEPEYREDVLNDRDEYTSENIFWTPKEARWDYLQANAKSPDIAKILDDAMRSIEHENAKLKGILYKEFARLNISDKLGQLIDEFSSINFDETQMGKGDAFGQVFEYFLGNFASSEGKRGGQYYTPASIVDLIVMVLAPKKGRIYDPACGSGGMFVHSENFVKNHHGNPDDISIYGQESNPTTWKLAAMNLAIRGFEFDLGREPADTFHNDQHKSVKMDFSLANPPFNISDWGGDKLREDSRWDFGVPPVGNANYGWLQHIYSKLSPKGRAGVVLANGSMSSNTSGEGDIRKAMIEADIVECMVALPGQLFTNTQIPACIWFLNRDKGKRKGETLFIDLRNKGRMVSRVQKELTLEELEEASQIYHNWMQTELAQGEYEDVAGFCKSASLEDIKKHDYVLTPGRYVGAAEIEDDGEPFAEKMFRLTAQLKEQFEESDRLEAEIKKNLGGLGYEF
jgi:type I restriction enzyme M protein